MKTKHSIEEARKAKAEKYLDSFVHYTADDGRGKIGTRREYLTYLIRVKGGKIIECQENRVAPMSRISFFRADNDQQAAHAKRIKDAGTHTVYYVDCGDFRSCIKKTDVEYCRTHLGA